MKLKTYGKRNFLWAGLGLFVVGFIMLIASLNGGNAGAFSFIRHNKAKAAAAVTSSSSQVDLLADGTYWQEAGVTQNIYTHKLQVNAENLNIVNQDGTPNQINPSVNLYGTALQVKGGFGVTVGLSNVTNSNVHIGLYGTPPLVEDEYRAELGSVLVNINGNNITTKVATSSGKAQSTQSATISDVATHTLGVIDTAGRLNFYVDGVAVGNSVSDNGIFKSGKIYLGFNDLTAGQNFSVDSLTSQGLNGGTVALYDTRTQQITPNPTGFAALADQKRPGFLVGAAVALGPMVSDSKYQGLLGNYNAVSTENVGKFQFIHPLAGNDPADYNFSDMDAVVAIAQKAGMKVHGHALVFGEANPAWVQDVAKNTPSQLQQVMTDHITSVVSHYKGKVDSWDVVNEPLADYDTTPGVNGLRKNIWYNAIGPSYIATALKTAHAADPSAQLWINDFGMESDSDRFNQMLNLVKQLQSEGVPLTGVGFQAHIDSGDTISNDTHVDVNQLRSRFQALNALGLKARVSELDVTNDTEYPVFGDVFTACLAEPNCVGVTTWGITDKYSSSGDLSSNGAYSTGFGLPWDDQEVATPAVDNITKSLQP